MESWSTCFDAMKECTTKGATPLGVAVFNPIACALLKDPGACGADIAAGEGQPLGIPMQLGGPYLGLFAAKKEFLRTMPGRLVGETKDSEGRRAFSLVLQTREQHIRGAKATSNICTAQALLAVISHIVFGASFITAAIGISKARRSAYINGSLLSVAVAMIASVVAFSSVQNEDPTPALVWGFIIVFFSAVASVTWYSSRSVATPITQN